MPSNEFSLRRLVALGGVIAGGALLFARFSTLSLGGVTVRTSFVAGLAAGLFLLPSVVSHYRSGDTRASVQWGLFAVGIPIALSRYAPLTWLGVLALFVSVGVGRRVDRRLLGSLSR